MTHRRLFSLTSVLIGALAMSVFALSTPAAAAPQLTLQSSAVLQIPGGVLGKGGAAAYQPRVFYGRGAINPTPVGYGYIYSWRNLTTGVSGVITDHTPHRDAVRTGAGQLVVTGQYANKSMNLIASTPSVGTFYVPR